MAKTDLAIIGGGLAGGLIALALQRARPDLAVTIFEKAEGFSDQHTWSFHDTDLETAGRALIEPFVAHHWAAQTVAFPQHKKRFTTGYNTITAERFKAVMGESIGERMRFGADVVQLTANDVTLASGERIEAGAVIDCRGDLKSDHITLGFQKFIGQVVRLENPHGVTAPMIMDATVSQLDGYRFFYLLPFDERTLLIEDTRYTDGRELAPDAFRAAIAAYASEKGWVITETIREEAGVLPIALAGDINAFWDAAPPGVAGRVARGGMRAGLFHPMTGYSLPDAVALALKVAGAPDLSGAGLYALTRDHSVETWEGRGFYRLLVRMLFRAGVPHLRYRPMERFYTLPQRLIERFYAGRSTLFDKARVLTGKPPVPFFKAVTLIPEDSVIAAANSGGNANPAK